MAGRVQQIVINDFSGGLNTRDKPHQLAINQCAILQNFDIIGKGAIQSRYGYDIVSTGGSSSKGVRGLAYYQRTRTTNEKFLCIFNNGALYTITPSSSTWVTRSASTFDDTNSKRVNHTIAADMVIYGNGDHRVRKFGESLIKNNAGGTNEYALTASVNEGATHLYTIGAVTSGRIVTRVLLKPKTRGTGDWTITLHDAANATLATATIANDNINQEIFNIFSLEYTSAGETMHIHLTSTVADGVAYVGTSADFTTANVEVYGIYTASLGGDPPKGSIFASNVNAVFMGGVVDTPSRLYWSDADIVGNSDYAETWQTGIAGSQNIAQADGQRMTGIKIHNNQAMIFKEYSKYGLDQLVDETTDATNPVIVGFEPNEIKDKSDGALSSNSIIETWDGYYFYGENGFQKFGQEEAIQIDRRIPSSMSFPIEPTVNKIHRKQVEKIASVKWQNRLYWSCPVNGASVNNQLFVINETFPNKPWTIHTGMNFSSFAKFEDSKGERNLYAGDENSGTIYKLNKKFIDRNNLTSGEGFPIVSTYRSPTFIPSFKNWFRRVFIIGSMTRPGEFKLRINVDGQTEYFIVTDSEIQWQVDVEGVRGYERVGDVIRGGQIASDSSAPLYTFLAELHFSQIRNITEGREIYVELENSKLGYGLSPEKIIIEYQSQSDSVVKKS